MNKITSLISLNLNLCKQKLTQNKICFCSVTYCSLVCQRRNIY